MSPHKRQGSFLDLNSSPTLQNRWMDQIIPEDNVCEACGHKGVHFCMGQPAVANTKKSK